MEKKNLQLAKEKAAKLLAFFTEKAEPVIEQVFESVKIKDSDSILDYTELKEGADVSVSGKAGSEVPNDGNYVLVNGVEIIIKDGKIQAITKEADAPIEAEVEMAVEAPVATELPVEAPKNDELKTLEDKVAKLEEMIASIMEVVDLVPSKEDVNQFNENVKALAKLPTQLSADNRIDAKESEMDKYNRIANSYQKNK